MQKLRSWRAGIKWEDGHLGKPSAGRFYELVGDEGFVAAHGGPKASSAYLDGYTDALEDAGALSQSGARAFRAALAMGEINRSELGHALDRGGEGWPQVQEILHEARVYEPVEYCMLNGVDPGADAGKAMLADLCERARDAAGR